MALNQWEGAEGSQEEIAIGEENSDEVECPRVAPDPGQPTARQVADHRLIHTPFRTWCQWCIMGRGKGPHHSRRHGESAVAIVGLDYFFITRAGVKTRLELEEFPQDDAGEAALAVAREAGELIKCIILRCSKTKAIFAHVVPCKGVDEDDYVATLVIKILEWLGHTAVILKADNERALQALVSRVIRIATAKCQNMEQIAREHPARYDSQSNGLIEVGVMLVRGFIRTLKLCLESRIERRVPEGHAIVPWLLVHTCLILNSTIKGPDGFTAWSRVRGRQFHHPMMNFAEQVLYKLPTKGPLSRPDGNMGTKWLPAT